MGIRLKEKERSQNDVTASVSADHDYNGQIAKTKGNIINCCGVLLLCFYIYF